jgi:hypothetical protein
MRDELTYYLCFFMQAYAVRDWLTRQSIVKSDEIDAAIAGDLHMQICRDICNRCKHLTLSNPSIDADWSIYRQVVCHFMGDDWEWMVSADGHRMSLWQLMVACIGFWEVFVAAYGLHSDVTDMS